MITTTTRRPPARRRFIGAAAALIAAAALTGGCNGIAYETREKQLTIDFAPGAALEVVTANGSVVVNPGAEPTVFVRATVRAQIGRADQVSLRATNGPAGALVLTTEWPEGKRRGGEGCSFAITTPSVAGVTVRTTNGRIEVSGMGGLADLDTSNGKITLKDHAGDARLDTNNGSITAVGVAGSLVADTSNGGISVSGVGGPVEAKTSNGSMTFALGPAFRGPLKARSSNGSMTLRLAEGTPGTFSLSSSNGSVRIAGAAALRTSVSRRSATVTLADGPESTLTSSNGSIRVELPDALTEPPAPLPQARAPLAPADAPLIGSGVIPASKPR